MRTLRWFLAALALGAGLLAVPGVLPAGSAADAAPAGATGPGRAAAAADGASAGGAPAGGVPAGGVPAAGAPAAGAPADGAPAPRSAAPSTPARAPGVTAADALAGVLRAEVPPAGTGTTTVVAGSTPAPGPGPVRTVRVEVEGGLPVDPEAFAEFALDGLNDPRGWGRDGAMSFARTDGPAEIVVVLASPQTAQQLCVGLDTGGTLSCRVGERAVITHYRWVLAHPDYGADRTAYRRYVVNHEVGHVLGHGHVPCPGPGVPAPVMMQQTKGLLGCAPNPWPHP